MPGRKEHWQNIYQDKSATDVSWYQKEPRLSMALIQRCGIYQDDAIIDVGGGASVLVDFLTQAGFTRLTVLDISGNALSSAKQRLAAQAKDIRWIETDITDFRPPQPYTLWHDRAVFHFLLDASDRKKYVDVLKQSLIAGGHVIIAAFGIGGPKKCSGLDIVQYDAEKIQAELGDDFELIEEEVELHITPANKEQKFMYFHFVRTFN